MGNYKTYELMNKDLICLTFREDFTIIDFNPDIKLPYGMQNDPNCLKYWLMQRFNVGERKYYDKLMNLYNVKPADTILKKCEKTYATSYRDCYWVKLADDNTRWDEVSPYTSYYNEFLTILLGDEESLPPIPSKACAEFTYRGNTAKGYYRDINTGKLSVYKIPNDNQALFREILSSAMGRYFGLNGLNYQLIDRNFNSGQIKQCLIVDSTATEEEGFITLSEFLGVNGIEYDSVSTIDVLNNIPEEYQEDYILTRVLLFILDSENAIEDRFSFRVANDSQEICGYFGVFGNSKCLLYGQPLSNYKSYRSSEQLSEKQSGSLENLNELLQTLTEELNRRLDDKLANITEVFDSNLKDLAIKFIGEEEYSAIKEFILDGANYVLDIIRNLNDSNKGVLETVDNTMVYSYETNKMSKYDNDGFLRLAEDSSYSH